MKETKTVRKSFTVFIRDKEYDVYDINGKEHSGMNGEVKTWWIYFADRIPDGTLPPHDSESFIPYDRDINRRLWNIIFTQKNTHKIKWDDHRFSNTTVVEMWCNKKLIYSFNTWGNDAGMSYAMAKVQYMQTMLSEHPYNFFEPEKENGRKIFWYGLPAFVRVKSYTWEIAIVPDYALFKSQSEWWNELKRRQVKITNTPNTEDEEMDEDHFNENKDFGEINWGDAFSDQHIDWFRK